MPDTKITALTALTAADPANDVLPIVDVSDTTMAASGTTKKISINNVLGASGTATLASATITGDLTVDTSTLKVDSANNWVGVGTASPAVRLHSNVADAAEAARFSASTAILRVFPYVDATDKTKIQAANSTITGLSDLTVEGLNLRFNTNAGLVYAISNTGVATWSNVGGVAGTAMTLNANGLGVGVSPSYNLDVRAATATANVQSSTGTNGVSIVARNTGGSFTIGKENSVGGGSGVFGQDAYASVIWSTGAYPIAFGTNGSQRVVVKSTGQVKFTPLSADPSGAEAGDVYYNSTSNKLKCYNGTTWNDLF